MYGLPPHNPELLPAFVRALPADGAGQLALFDADGTLWRNDVADDFCCWMIKTGRIQTGSLWPEYLRIYKEDCSLGCQFMLRFYKGLSREALLASCREWWRLHDRQWIPEVLESLDWLHAHHYICVVVTGSPTETLMPLCDALPVHSVVGMDFELKEGIITGNHKGISCAEQGKALKVQELFQGIPVAFAAGNGILDTAMIALSSGVRWAVYPDDAFRQIAASKGWHVLPRPFDFVEELKLR